MRGTQGERGDIAQVSRSPLYLPVNALTFAICLMRRLNGNNIGPEGGKALAESLKGNLTLTSLR